jgi:hypothetical protein
VPLIPVRISDEELRAAGFKRAGTVYPDPRRMVRVDITEDVPGCVAYLMRVKGEVKKVGITGTGASGFRQRMNSTFSALRTVMTGPRPGRPPARWRSRKFDPFKEHAPATIRAGHEIELWALRCRSVDSTKAKETELNQKFRPKWTKEGRG